MRKPIQPSKARKSEYGVDPKYVEKRAAELPNMTSLLLKDLFPDTPETIYPSDKGIQAVREATEKALKDIDMSMIEKDDSVNICASHHGFTLLGGEPYAEMIKTVRDVVNRRTGAENIRLRAGVGLRFRETEEYIREFGLDDYFKGKTKGIAPVDEGIPIETELGTLYGIKSVYDADWIIHTHNSDVREIHFHRQVDRAVKPFAMSYARIESRSTYHWNLGPRASNFVARAIFGSDLVQEKFAFTTFLEMSPVGAIGVDADNDLYALNDRMTASGLKNYGKIVTLFGEIEDCISVLDFPCPVPYVFAAGVIYANFTSANKDLFDLDYALPPYTWYTEAFYDEEGKPLTEEVPPLNPAINMVVHNYAWGGYPSAFFTEHTPTVVVTNEQAEILNRDPQNQEYMDHAVIADKLDTAMDFAYNTTGTENVIIFDGAMEGLNLSKPLAKRLKEKAEEVSKRVDNDLMPKWLKQRGLDPSILK
jgi:hypothetical protein